MICVLGVKTAPEGRGKRRKRGKGGEAVTEPRPEGKRKKRKHEKAPGEVSPFCRPYFAGRKTLTEGRGVCEANRKERFRRGAKRTGVHKTGGKKPPS